MEVVSEAHGDLFRPSSSRSTTGRGWCCRAPEPLGGRSASASIWLCCCSSAWRCWIAYVMLTHAETLGVVLQGLTYGVTCTSSCGWRCSGSFEGPRRIVLYATGWSWLTVPWLPIALIGTAVAFITGFKNNASYARLWEARQIWGGIVNTSRSFGVMACDYLLPEPDHPAPPSTSGRAHGLVARHIALADRPAVPAARAAGRGRTSASRTTPSIAGTTRSPSGTTTTSASSSASC